MKEKAYFSSKCEETDWLGMDDGSSKLPDLVPSTRREVDLLRTKALDPFDESGARETYTSLIKSFNDQNLNLDNSTVGPVDNSGVNFSYADIYNVGESQLGLISSVYYSNSYQVNNIERNALQDNGSNFFVSEGAQTSRNINWGAFDITIPVGQTKFKVGSLVESRTRDFYARSFAFVPPPLGSDYGEDIRNVINDLDNLNTIFSNENFRIDDGF